MVQSLDASPRRPSPITPKDGKIEFKQNLTDESLLSEEPDLYEKPIRCISDFNLTKDDLRAIADAHPQR